MVGLAAAGFLFAPLLGTPYMLDDWGKLALFAHHGPLDSLLQTLRPTPDQPLFRPVSAVYVWLLYQLFGAASLPMHLAALLWLAAGGAVHAALLRAVGFRRSACVAAGCCVPVCASLLLDTMVWGAGINDLAPLVLAGGAALLFLRGRFRLAALTWFVALLFKESALFLPLVLLLAAGRPNGGRPGAAARFLTLWPFVPAGTLYLAIRWFGGLSLRVAQTHPYALEPAQGVAAGNLACFSVWMVEALVPLHPLWGWVQRLEAACVAHAGLTALACLAAALLAVVAAAQRDRGAPRAEASRLFLTLWVLGWIVMVLLPVLFLRQHCYRYYVLLAFPPLAAAVASGWSCCAERWGGPRAVRPALAVWLLAQVLLGGHLVRTLQGIDEATPLPSGTNALIQRAANVRLVERELPRLIPHLPPGAVVLFEGLEPWSFRRASGLRVWYRTWDVEVGRPSEVGMDRHGLYLPIYSASLSEIGRRPLQPGRTFLIRREGQRLVRLPVPGDPLEGANP